MKPWFSSGPTRLEVMRKALAGNETRYRVLYADCEPFPTKADVDLRMADAQNQRDMREEIQAREQERQLRQSVSPKVRPFQTRGVAK